MLRRAGVDSAIALVSATSSDIVNLETAMQARAMRGEDLRIVLRLFDDDLAHRVSETLGNVVSRSVSYLAAPAFAVAMLEHKVLRTIAVGRHVLVHRGRPGRAGLRHRRPAAGRPRAGRALPGPRPRRARDAAVQTGSRGATAAWSRATG